jgi:hypothetical protein
MMKDAWDDYERWAWGFNELKPVTQSWTNGGIFGNASIGATIGIISFLLNSKFNVPLKLTLWTLFTSWN